MQDVRFSLSHFFSIIAALERDVKGKWPLRSIKSSAPNLIHSTKTWWMNPWSIGLRSFVCSIYMRGNGSGRHKLQQWLHLLILASCHLSWTEHVKSIEVNKPTCYTGNVESSLPSRLQGPTEPWLWRSWWEQQGERSFGSIGCMFFFFFYVCVRVAASCSRGNEECTHLHLINDKGASNVWGLETIHSYCGRGTAEGQIDICSGGFYS